MIDDRTGYIKINRFAYTTMDEFHQALADLKIRGLDALIIDLSGNGGGYLDVAIQLADELLDQQKLIVYTEGINHPKRNYNASSDGDFQEGRLVIIIDEGSASASEIVAGAVQDWDRGIIVGRRSFGKGLVQSPLKLIDSSMVRLTIARYYTPTGRLIQKPYSQGYEDYSNDLINRFNKGELSDEDKIIFPDSLRYQTLLSGRTVYGGGGIMPDYFVPIDTTYVSDYYREIIGRGIFNIFVLNYVDNNRSVLTASYPAFDLFRDHYNVSDELMKQLVDYAGHEGLLPDEEGYNVCKDQIRLLLKAYIARDLWDTSSFYEIFNRQNPAVIKAIEVLDSSTKYQAVLQNK
jgi:carboxyl-terminal processing protease